jgi:hypothetical protein
MGVNLQQRVRIHIEYIGRRQQARYPDRTEEDRPDALIRTDENLVEGRPLFSMAHPGNPTVTQTWQDEAREHLVEQMTMMQQAIDLLGRM